jgi:hypothetical protein
LGSRQLDVSSPTVSWYAQLYTCSKLISRSLEKGYFLDGIHLVPAALAGAVETVKVLDAGTEVDAVCVLVRAVVGDACCPSLVGRFVATLEALRVGASTGLKETDLFGRGTHSEGDERREGCGMFRHGEERDYV